MVSNRQTLIIFAVVAVIGWFRLTRTTFGRRSIVVAVLLRQRLAARGSRQ